MSASLTRDTAIGVVILNFGEFSDTVELLGSLERSDDLDLDIVVVDNAPDDEEHARLRDEVGRRAETLATGGNLGYAGGNNVGISRLLERGRELVWLMNPDTRLVPATVPTLRAHLDLVEDCGIAGPRVLMPGDPPRVFSNGGTVDRRTGAAIHRDVGGQPADPTSPYDVDYVTGASLLFRSDVVADIGLLPEDYFLYFEETDWCLRAADAGWRCMVEPRTQVVHHRRSGRELPSVAYVYYMTRNCQLFAQRRLDLDPQIALAEHRRRFLEPWRERVARLVPSWLTTFDEVVDQAVRDARAGVGGRQARLDGMPSAVDAREQVDA